jgi:hypothetical protein
MSLEYLLGSEHLGPAGDRIKSINFYIVVDVWRPHNNRLTYISSPFALCCVAFACVLVEIGPFSIPHRSCSWWWISNVLNAQFSVTILKVHTFHAYLLFAAFVLLACLLWLLDCFDTALQLQLMMNFIRLRCAIRRRNINTICISCIFAFNCFCFACLLVEIGRCFRYRTAAAADDEFVNVLNAQSGVKILNFH